jgi:chromosome segregation ATPase
MARAGIYFSDVKRARDSLVAQGRHPSIDAVREALGNTGSKTTIHRYLRELEVEEGGQKAPVSEAILALVSQLAARLEEDAATQVQSMRIQLVEQQAADGRVRSALEAQLAEARQALDAVSRQLESSLQETVTVNGLLNQEQIARHTAEQHAVDLGERLADAQRHQASLEDKHEHARNALEHYRNASKEQREQESRRHEQQVQVLQSDVRQAQLTVSVKQEELTRLNKEAAALATELRATKHTLHEEREASRALVKKVEQQQALEARIAILNTQLAESRTHLAQVEQTSARTVQLCEELRHQNGTLQSQLANANQTSTLEARLAKLDAAVFGKADTGADSRSSGSSD